MKAEPRRGDGRWLKPSWSANGRSGGGAKGGLEPPRPFARRNLKPVRLPIPPLSRARRRRDEAPRRRYHSHFRPVSVMAPHALSPWRSHRAARSNGGLSRPAGCARIPRFPPGWPGAPLQVIPLWTDTPMKVDYTDVSVTEKSLVVEIPTEVVETRSSASPTATRAHVGCRGSGRGRSGQGRPAALHPQILQDVADDLIPRAVDDVLRERGVEPVDTPSVKDVSIDEHQPLKFTAAIATAPPVDAGDCDDPAAQAAGQRAGRRGDVDDRAAARGAARFEPVEGRGAQHRRDGGRGHDAPQARQGRRRGRGARGAPGREHRDRGGGQPAGVRRGGHRAGAGDAKTFTIDFPAEYPVESLAGRRGRVRGDGQRGAPKVLPALDDEFAKDLGYGSLDGCGRWCGSASARGGRTQEREVRQDLLKQLAGRVDGDAPEALVTREVDRRRRGVRPPARRPGRRPAPDVASTGTSCAKAQREAAVETVKCALVLDELSRRESLTSRTRKSTPRSRAWRSARPEPARVRTAAREGRRHRPYFHGVAAGEDD